MKRYAILLSVLLVLLMPATMFAVYYQYTDENNVVRFTDDPSLIPEKQQSSVKVFESTQSEYVPEADHSEHLTVQDQASPQISKGESAVKMDELNAKRKELRKAFNELQAEKKALGNPPSKQTGMRVKETYKARADALNRKIDDYHQRLKEFDEALKEYNSKFGMK